ncbi:MAG: tetratricopeptide repeat protein [Bdellovibrionales bacterium]
MRFFKHVVLSVVCFAFLLPLMGCDNPEQKTARYIRRGNALYEEGDYKKARIEYKNAAKLAPTNPEPYYKTGLIDEQEGDLRSAFGNYITAERQNARFFPALLKVAQFYMAAEQYEESRKRISAALDDNPNNAEAHALYAALLLREGKHDEAEKEAVTALTIDPSNISGCAALTGIYSAKKEYDKAETAINNGIAKNPKYLPLMVLRVLLFEKMNDLKKVEEAYQPIFKLKPEETKFRLDLANSFVRAGKLDEAEASLRKSISELPKKWDLKRQYVLFLDKNRGLDAAEKEIKELIKANPDSDDLYFWLADLYTRHNAADKAIELLNSVVEREEFSAPALNARAILARLNLKRGNRDLAEKLIGTVLAKAPDNRSALLVRAKLAAMDGYYQSAVSDLRSIVRTNPNDQEALQVLAETLLMQGHLDLAIDTMKKLADLNPLNFPVRVRLAQMVHMNGDTKGARELISLVTKSAPEYAIAWETAARFAIDTKEWLLADEAVRTLDKIEGQHLTASFLRGQIFDKNGKNDEAIAKYSEVVNADPTSTLAEHALRALIVVYNKTGHLDTYAHYLETLKADTPLVNTLIGKSYATIGKKAEGAAAFDKAIEAKAPFADPYLDRANMYLEEHKQDQALEILKKGAAAAPNDFRAPLIIGTLLTQAGKFQEAIALYDSLLLRNPRLDVAANNLAELIADYQFNDSVALDKAQKTAERFSGSTNPLFLDTLAWVYYRQGNTALAQTIIERAIAQEQSAKPLPPQVHYHFGVILMKSGKTDRARAELQKAVVEGADYPGLEEAKKMLAQ